MNTQTESRSYFCYKFSQRGIDSNVRFAAFVANAKDINNWSGTRRVGVHEKGTQRVIKETRLKAIKRFLEADRNNTIPVSVVLAFNEHTMFRSIQTELKQCLNGNIDLNNGIGEKGEWGILSFNYNANVNEEDKPALIVDGQHRVRGMASMTEDIPILAIAILESTPEEQAFQFIVINNKAQKVSPDNVKALIRNIDSFEEQLSSRLTSAGINYGNQLATIGDINELENSPFHRILKWPLTPEDRQKVDISTIENCLKYLRSQLPIIQDDDETIKEVFLAIWRAVKKNYSDLWENNEKFLSKVNINALNEYIADKVSFAWVEDRFNLYNPEEVEKYCSTIINPYQTPSEFWERSWAFKLQDNAIVRNKIKEDLRRISQNIKSEKDWDDNLSLIN